jgi:iron complex outermembrane receptor protein
MHRLRRIGFAVAFVTVWLAGCLMAHAMASGVTFDIAAGAAPTTLKEFASQAHVQLLFDYKAVQSLRTPAVRGQFEPSEALKMLLRGSGLTFRQVNDRTIAVMPIGSESTTSGSAPADQSPTDSNDKEGKKNSSDQFRVAQVDQGASASASAVDKKREQASENKTVALEEVIVTAQKRSEHIQDVPVPVTAISGETLLAQNYLRLQDYYSEIPGLSVSTSSVGGYQLLSIRGLTTGLANPTVGITIDDVPYGSSTVNGGNVPPDIDPGNLARVEVLRGPQGTLYGASSIGGLIKFVTVDPSMDAFSGNVQAGTSSVRNGAELGYNFRTWVNMPFSDTLAVRLSGFTRKDPGYIDNPVLHIDGVNKDDAFGGNLSALWRPSDVFSLKFSALLQELKAYGLPDVDIPALAASVGYPLPPLGDLQQDYIPGGGAYETKVQAYSATAHAKLGIADLTSITGYNINTHETALDFSYLFGPYVQGPFGVTGALSPSGTRTSKFNQELRLNAQLGEKVDWLLGGFYTHESSPYQASILAENPTTGAIAGEYGLFTLPNTYQEIAGFTDFTFHVVDRFDIQLGGRESQIRQTYQQTDSGPYVAVFEGVPSPNVGPEGHSKASAFTYLLTPTFKFSPDLMTYARLASGYRAGGPNVGAGVPPQYLPDKTYNYEIGTKGDVLDHRLSFDVSAYYIDWKDIQLTLFNTQTGATYTSNAGGAKSEGLELSVESRPVTGLKLSAWIVWDDAELTKPFPAAAVLAGTYGVPGDRLPYATRLSGYGAFDWDFAISAGVTASLGASVSYVGDRLGPFTGSATRQDFPAYAETNLRAALKYDSWTADLYVTNLTDRRGVLDGGLGTNIPYDFHYLQPRTVGLNLSKRF